MIDELREELYLYNLLRQIFLKEPSKELIHDMGMIELTSGNPEISELKSFVEDMPGYGLRLMVGAIRKNENTLNEWIEDLALEYARLFIGPQNPPAVPYASFYLSESHSLMTDETIDVRKQYLEAGMAVKELYSIPDDHIGIELEFVYYLTQKTIEFFEREQRDEAARLFEIRGNFLNNHMAQWVPLFVARILNSTHEDFYKGAAFILRGIIAS
ncbi:MAG: molecular chaperone TorD family protein [Nitrospirae bacterium]|nr:molecular chaperone TorD family protein [Nitrospirota bacterium]MCL5977199.1 molecular chaperone TorD family protein [Nitrospirota bacterium]